MNKGNQKKQQHPEGAEVNPKRSAAVAVEESLGGLEEKYDEVQKLIDIGKEKGYLLYDEVSDLLPPEISSSAEDLDDLFSAFGTAGIEVIDTDDQSFAGLDKVAGEKKFEEQPEDIELDLTPGALEKTNDPVRMYLREMGTVPLLTRDGEVEIAKRIERGQMTVLKSLSRSAVIVREIIALGDQLMTDPSIIKDILQVSEQELSRLERKADHTKKEYRKAIQKDIRHVKSRIAAMEDDTKSSALELKRTLQTIMQGQVQAEVAKRELVEANLRLVVSIAKKYTNRGLQFRDLIQEGNIGLMKAVDKFEYMRGYKFSTYATWWVRQAMTRAIADQARSISIPVHMIETINKLV